MGNETLHTASQINDPQTGRIEFDPDYRRGIPIHNETNSIESLVRKLQQITNNDFDKCGCQTCEYLRLQCALAVEARREADQARQNEVMLRKLQEDD